MVKIMMMSDLEAFEVFKNIRWNTTNGEPVCPCCGSVKKLECPRKYRQFFNQLTPMERKDKILPSIDQLKKHIY